MKRWALVLLGALVVATAAGCAAGDDDDGPSRIGDAGATDGFAMVASPERGAAGNSADAASPPGMDGAAADYATSDTRKVIVTSELTLRAEDVTARFLEVGRVARTRGGFVSDSQLLTRESGGETVSYATVSIRVPSSSHDEVLMALRSMEGVEVRGEQSTAREVTEEYTDLSSRLKNFERTEAQYLQLLAQASTIEDILRVNDRIDGVRLEIERIRGRLNVLDDLVDLATITVSLEPASAETLVAQTEGGNRFVEAWKDAWSSMGALAGDASVVGAWGIVLAICAAPFALAAFAVRGLARRRTVPGASGPSTDPV